MEFHNLYIILKANIMQNQYRYNIYVWIIYCGFVSIYDPAYEIDGLLAFVCGKTCMRFYISFAFIVHLKNFNFK